MRPSLLLLVLSLLLFQLARGQEKEERPPYGEDHPAPPEQESNAQPFQVTKDDATPYQLVWLDFQTNIPNPGEDLDLEAQMIVMARLSVLYAPFGVRFTLDQPLPGVVYTTVRFYHSVVGGKSYVNCYTTCLFCGPLLVCDPLANKFNRLCNFHQLPSTLTGSTETRLGSPESTASTSVFAQGRTG